MNPRLDLLHPYPFEKLRALLDGVTPPAALKPISWSIGEPKHPAPPFVLETVRQHLDELGLYPPINGIVELREAIAAWASRRFDLPASVGIMELEAGLPPRARLVPLTGLDVD